MSGNNSTTLPRGLGPILAAVQQMTQDFDALASRERMNSARMRLVSNSLPFLADRSSSRFGTPPFSPAIQGLQESLARRKALGKALDAATAALAQVMIRWIEELKRRQAQQRRIEANMDPVSRAILDYQDVATAAYAAGNDALPVAENAAAGHPDATTDAQLTQMGLTLQAFAKVLLDHGVNPYDESGTISDQVYHAAIHHYQDLQAQWENDFIINHPGAYEAIETTNQILSNPFVQATLIVAPVLSEIGNNAAESVSTSLSTSIESSMPRRFQLGPGEGKWIAEAADESTSTSESTAAPEPAETIDDSLAIVPKGAGPLGQWGEIRLGNVLDNAGVKPDKPFMTDLGPRYSDRLLDETSHEAKAGIDVELTSRVQLQIDKDVELIKTGAIIRVHWHFFQGADDELLEELTNRGINYTLHK